MNKKKKKEIIESYNSESYNEIYDRRYRSIQFEKFKSFIPNFQPIKGFLLDYGGGTGLFWEFLNSRNDLEIKVDEIRFICIDISSGMLDIFKDKLLKSRKSSNTRSEDVHLICCDGEHIPIRSDRFDHIYAFTSLQNLSNLDLGLKEISRVKKKGSFIAISYLRKKISRDLFEKKLRKSFEGLQIRLLKTHSTEDWVFKIR